MKEAELIARLEDLAPLLEENAPRAERERKPVDSVMSAIEATGAYRYFVPKRFGGYEFSVEGFMRIGMSLGEACMSTAWVVTFCMEHNWLLSLFDRQAQEDIFGSQPYIIGPGMLAPMGEATPEDGGFRLTGRWEWGTGVMHADWVLVGARTAGCDAQQPDLYMYAVPRSEVTVLETWNPSGMVGTGSNEVRIDNVFVPGHRRQDVNGLRDGGSPGARWHDRPLYRMPMLPFLGLTATAPLVGGARKAVRLFQDRVARRAVYGTADKQKERAVTQARLGRVTARMVGLEKQLLGLGAETCALGTRGGTSQAVERAELRVRVAMLVREARDIVTEVIEASGAHAHFLDNPLQRIQRDINTAAGHTVFDLDAGTELYGRLLLGYPPNLPI